MRQRGKLVGMAKWAILAVVLCLLLCPGCSNGSRQRNTKRPGCGTRPLLQSRHLRLLLSPKEQGVDTIFLQIQDELPDATYRKFIAAARQAEIEVHGLNGHADWAYEEKRDEGLAFIERVRAYNAASAKNERFQGIQLDVEPYQLKRWRTRRAASLQSGRTT